MQKYIFKFFCFSVIFIFVWGVSNVICNFQVPNKISSTKNRSRSNSAFHLWMFPKIVGFPQIIYFNKVFHYFHHPFWEKNSPIYDITGNTYRCQGSDFFPSSGSRDTPFLILFIKQLVGVCWFVDFCLLDCYMISNSGFFIKNEWRVLKIMTFGKGVLVSWSAYNQDETALGSTTFGTCWIRIVHSDSIESLEVQLPIHQKPDECRVSITKIPVVVFGLVSTYLPHRPFLAVKPYHIWNENCIYVHTAWNHTLQKTGVF